MYESSITVSAPALAQAITADENDRKQTELKVNIHIAEGNEIYINNEKMPADTALQNGLIRELLKRSLQRFLMVSADPTVYHYQVVDILDRVKQCGAVKIAVVKRKKQKN